MLYMLHICMWDFQRNLMIQLNNVFGFLFQPSAAESKVPLVPLKQQTVFTWKTSSPNILVQSNRHDTQSNTKKRSTGLNM